MPNPPLIIAIDGPSGAGKGTVARAVASALGYTHVDTGAMYRAVAWKAANDGVPLDDDGQVTAVAERARLDLDDAGVRIDGHDVTRAIRTPEIDQAAARVARLPGVRSELVARQRALGANRGVVMEGRDIGSVVFPEADVKVYLDASATERARRRTLDPAHTGQQASVDGVQEAMVARDRSDSERPVAPLTLAKDAIYIDTTDMPIDDVIEKVLGIIRARQERLQQQN